MIKVKTDLKSVVVEKSKTDRPSEEANRLEEKPVLYPDGIEGIENTEYIEPENAWFKADSREEWYEFDNEDEVYDRIEVGKSVTFLY